MKTRKQHYVEFVSPGTFVHETSVKPIEQWDCAMAVSMAKAVTERHGAKPFGFRFFTNLEAEPVADEQGVVMEVRPKQIAKSGLHFIGGTILTAEDIKARNDANDRILISNMEGNGIAFVCENTNSYKSTNPFDEGDFVVDPDSGKILDSGKSPERMKIRKSVRQAYEARYAKAATA